MILYIYITNIITWILIYVGSLLLILLYMYLVVVVVVVVVAELLLWTPKHGKTKPGRPRKTFIDQLVKDTECVLNELPAAMEDRSGWKKRCC